MRESASDKSLFGGLRRFLATPPGLAVLLVVAVLTLTGSFLYLGPFLAIVAFLLFGLAVPIYAGWKRLRILALFGLAALVISGPIISALYVGTVVRVPSASADSSSALPYGNGGPILQGAQVAPFTSDGDGPFNFSVTVNPANVPANASPPLWLDLFISTCPGATGNSSPYCGGGYPFYLYNLTLTNLTGPTVESFNVRLPAPNVWWWQMATAYLAAGNGTNRSVVWVFLTPASGYSGVQGPISGDFLSTFELVLVPLYLDLFIYPGLVFFLGLALYAYLKYRQARRAAQGGAPAEPTPAEGAAKGGAAPPGAGERTCPNCQAVVYASETSCWKCGQALPPVSAPSEALPSGPPKP